MGPKPSSPPKKTFLRKPLVFILDVNISSYIFIPETFIFNALSVIIEDVEHRGNAGRLGSSFFQMKISPAMPPSTWDWATPPKPLTLTFVKKPNASKNPDDYFS